MIIEGIDDSVLAIALGLFVVSLTSIIGFLWNKRRVFQEVQEQPPTEEVLDQKRKIHPSDASTSATTTRIPLESGDFKCPNCLSTLSLATEAVPCSHAFCGSCLLEY